MRRPSLACFLAIGSFSAISSAFAADIEYGLDFSAERAHQVFKDSSADLDTVALQPYLQVDNWSFTLDVPWQRAKGEVFINDNFQPSPKYLTKILSKCDTYAAATPAQRQWLAKRFPNITNVLNTQCQNTAQTDNEVSGLSDVTGFVHYSMPLDEQGIWLGSIGLGYKADNGDADNGLGSGTSDAKLEGSLSAMFGMFTGTVTLGYDWVVGGSEADYVDNSTYASLDLSVKPKSWLILGANWNYQQAYVSGFDDVQSVSGYVTVKPLDKLKLRVYYKNYLSVENYPDHEVGGGVSYSF